MVEPFIYPSAKGNVKYNMMKTYARNIIVNDNTLVGWHSLRCSDAYMSQ